MNTRRLLVALMLALLIGTGGLSAATLSIDTTFGVNGIRITDFGLGDDSIADIGQQADGKIVAVGFSNNGAVKNLAVVRYLADGNLDPAFDSDGMYTVSLGTGDTQGMAVKILADGGILVAGVAVDSQNDLFVLRLDADGILDKAFGEDGVVRWSADSAEIVSGDLVVTAGGEILAAGTVKPSSGNSYVLVGRAGSDGQKDTAFGDSGAVKIENEKSISLNALALTDKGKVFGAGSLATDTKDKAVVYALKSDGSLDPDFGTDGIVALTDGTVGATITDMAVYNDAVYLVGWEGDDTTKKSILAKISTTGTLDPSFGIDGLYLTTLKESNEAEAVAIADTGQLYAAGVATTETNKDIFLVTMDLSGQTSTTDTTKSAVSYAVTDVANSADEGHAIAVLSDGRVAAAGLTRNATNSDFAVLAYTTKATSDTTSDAAASAVAVATNSDVRVVTATISEVTRTSAQTGGTISGGTNQDSCATTCSAQCSSSTDSTTGSTTDSATGATTDSTCYSTCIDSCTEPATVTKRGVVFSVEPSPTYLTDTANTTTGSTTTNTTDSTSTSSSTTSSSLTPTTENSIFPEGNRYAWELVRSGQTDDGEGTGSFVSDITEITPGTTYYVRAYALLSDTTIVYGNELVFTTSDACFIATAAFGSLWERPVTILREFRDRMLMSTAFGNKLVAAYYHLSPPLAAWIEGHPGRQAAVRFLLMPLVVLSYVLLHWGVLVKFTILVGGMVAVGSVIRLVLRTKRMVKA